MGFEIVAKSQNVDLKVIFDEEDKIYVLNSELHAYKGNDKESIETIYKDILKLASQQNIETLEIPIMHHTGINEIHIYPIVFKVINIFLENHEINIYLNLEDFSFYKNKPQIEKDLFSDIQNIMDESPIFKPQPCRSRRLPDFMKNGVNPARDASSLHIYPQKSILYDDFYLENQLDEMLKESKPITFGERLIQIIDEKGYAKDSIVYNKAMIDRRLYHNIISKKDYLPKKNTVILLALALELNEEEATDFLSYAGYSFSNSKKDQIILYCIKNKYYKIMYINGYLYDKGFNPLLTIE